MGYQRPYVSGTICIRDHIDQRSYIISETIHLRNYQELRPRGVRHRGVHKLYTIVISVTFVLFVISTEKIIENTYLIENTLQKPLDY